MSLGNKNQENIERIIRLMQTDKSVDAPQDAVKWAKNIFRARAAEPKRSLVQKIVAVLQIDLAPGKAAFGERSASSAAERQMLFKAGENAVDLRVKKDEKGLFDVRGQILGEGFANCLVKLGEKETKADDLSEFKLEKISAGSYELVFKAGENEIVIENLEIS